jgi:hypothetical protein
VPQGGRARWGVVALCRLGSDAVLMVGPGRLVVVLAVGSVWGHCQVPGHSWLGV